MTYRSKCIGKRRRDEGVMERWLGRRTHGRGVHTLCWWEGVMSETGRCRLKSSRVRKRSGYKPSVERQVRLLRRQCRAGGIIVHIVPYGPPPSAEMRRKVMTWMARRYGFDITP